MALEVRVSKAGPPLVGKVIPAAKVKNKLSIIKPPKTKQMYKGEGRYHRVMRVFQRDPAKAKVYALVGSSTVGTVGGMFTIGHGRNKLTRQRNKETQAYRKQSLARVQKRFTPGHGLKVAGLASARKFQQASLGQQMAVTGAGGLAIGALEGSYHSRSQEKISMSAQKGAIKHRQKINAKRTKKGQAPISGELKLIPSYRQMKKQKVSKRQDISQQDRRALRRLGYLGAGAGLVVAGSRGTAGALRLANRAKTPAALRRTRVIRARKLDQVGNIAGGVGAGTGGLLALPLIDQREYNRKKSTVKKSHTAFLTEEQISKVFNPEKNRARREKVRSTGLAGGALGLGGAAAVKGRRDVVSGIGMLKGTRGDIREGKAKYRFAQTGGRGGRAATSVKDAAQMSMQREGVSQQLGGVLRRRGGLKKISKPLRSKAGIAAVVLGAGAVASEKHRRGKGAKTYNRRYF